MHPGWERDASASPALLHLGPRHWEPSGAMHVENQSRQGRVGAAAGAGSLGGVVSGWGSPQQQCLRICRQPFFLLGVCRNRVCSITGFSERQRVRAPTHAAAPCPQTSPALGHGTQVLSSPLAQNPQAGRQAGTPSPQMSLKRFGERLIPSLLNAWKVLMLNLYRHN